MIVRSRLAGLAACLLLCSTVRAGPVIDPIPNVIIPAGKSLILPVTASSSGGLPLTYSVSSSANAIALVMHTNNPFWQLSVAQAAPTNAPGAYQTPFRGGFVTVTNVGAMTFLLFPEYAPHTINVFQGLTESGFYNSNTIFHRVVASFVIQGGDPLTNGAGGLVFQYDDEFNPQAIFSGNGQLALANSGKDTDGSQFFISLGPQRTLDFGYTLFGQLVRGFNVLTNISNTAVDTNSRPFAEEIIQQAEYVTNTTDTVLTLTATNISGITGKITVVADDGAGGRTTNTFTATTAIDTASDNNPFIYPPNTVTNLVAPLNRPLTNVISAVELDGDPLYWFPTFADLSSQLAISNSAGIYTNEILRTLTYGVTNQNGQYQFYVMPTNDYAGIVGVYFDVSSSAYWNIYEEFDLQLPPYDQQVYTFVFGDTPISGQSNSVAVLAGTPFANLLLATFTNGVVGSSATNFTAYVNWGDDVITAGVVGTNSAGQKTVLGSHSFAYPGSYPVYVQVHSAIGASSKILSYVAAIAAPPKLSLAGNPAFGADGFTFSVQPPENAGVSIQFSTNLKDWAMLTNLPGGVSSLTVRDSGATNSTARYYRALVP